MPEKLDVKQGTLALMILRTLEVLGPLHGYGVARRIEETSKTGSSSTTARCIPRCSSWSRRGSSTPSGASPRTTAGPSSTPSPPPAANSWPVKRANGTRPPT